MNGVALSTASVAVLIAAYFLESCDHRDVLHDPMQGWVPQTDKPLGAEPGAKHPTSVCEITSLANGARQFPLGCGFGAPLNQVRRYITDAEVCDALYADARGQRRVGIRCYDRGREPALLKGPLVLGGVQ